MPTAYLTVHVRVRLLCRECSDAVVDGAARVDDGPRPLRRVRARRRPPHLLGLALARPYRRPRLRVSQFCGLSKKYLWIFTNHYCCPIFKPKRTK